MIDPQVMKLIGFYQMLSPHGPKVFGVDIFKYITKTLLLIQIILLFVYVLNIYHSIEEVNELAKYIFLIASSMVSVFKLFSVIQHSDTLWNCIQLTSIDNLSYKYHNRHILKSGRTRTKLLTSHYTFWWFVSVITFVISPLFIKNYYIRIKIDNDIEYYRYNVLNFIFPVTGEFYNKHFINYYILESIITIILGHCILMYDILIISICITLRYQFKTIVNSYSTFHISDNKSMSKLEMSFIYCNIIYIRIKN